MNPIQSVSARQPVNVIPDAPNDDGTVTTPGATSPSLLPAPPASNTADVSEVIASLLVDSAFARRKTDREARALANRAADEAQAQQVQEMRNAANDKYIAARTDAWIEIGTGAVSLGALGASKLTDAGALHTVTASISEGMRSGGGDLAKGTGGLVSAGFTHDSGLETAASTQYENHGKTLRSFADDWNDDAKDAKEVMNKALDFLKEFQAAQQASRAAALHRA